MKRKNNNAICLSCGCYHYDLTSDGMCPQCQREYEIDSGEASPGEDVNDADYDPRLAM